MGPPAVPPPSHSSARSRASLKEAGAREADGTRSCGGGTAAQGRPITRPRGCVPPKRPPKRECASATAYDLKLTEGWLPSARARSCGGGGGAAASSRRRRLEGASEDTELVRRQRARTLNTERVCKVRRCYTLSGGNCRWCRENCDNLSCSTEADQFRRYQGNQLLWFRACK
jgi:hypothetical protein